MALNPPLDNYGNRTGVEFEFKVSGGNKYTGKGKVIQNKNK